MPWPPPPHRSRSTPRPPTGPPPRAWSGGLDPALISIAAPAGEAAPVGQIVQNNDVLVVYSTLHNAQSVYVTTIVDGASDFQVNAPGNLAANQLAVISDCAKSAVM